ncbi:uncharacterized protein L3040_002638 [Drepanopeziza brunnea f. sp. 'multigermtubi']|uniref:uncharacterized protein n=1 Tax=Drepanopeziza brunnea f. sp. 'multigermtubi' TaxID=698441 RepID=UPI0023A23466|nr:hypothetical protein L3040_002638 [Drepanopeziza brunnea f. sp. 'multigermtubi']
MIQMQRDPVSPTITQLSSRSPTPSPPGNTTVPHPRFPSRSPNRPPTSYQEPTDGETTRSSTRRRSSPSPAPATTRRRDATQSQPQPEPPAPATPTKLPQLPLLQDVSQYMNPQFPAVTAATANTTLEELAHLVRLSTYQERKRTHSRVRLQRSLVSTAISARLVRCGELANRTLVDNFRADEKKSFASLYNAIHDVRNSCDATRRFALLETDLEACRASPGAGGEPRTLSSSTFMHEIPQRSRESLLKFLTQIRTNPDYLASRICSLTPQELSGLLVFHQGLESINTVLPYHNPRSKGHVSSAHRASAHIPSPVERLLSFQRHDPLSALIHTCFANSAGPDSGEDLRRTDVWAATCAKLITMGKTGTDPFICCVLNVWTAMRDWSGKSNMEWYLMKILEDGAFLLEKAEDQAGTRIHVEPRNTKDTIAADEFYDAAVQGLFEVVDDPGEGGIPEGLIELGNAILRKLDPKLHFSTRKFFVSKWLFSVFLLGAVIHPESYGMMAEYHITEYGRQKILKEVIMRAHKLVADMLWRDTVSTPLAVKSHIENIMARFRPSRPSKSKAKLLPARSITSLRETVEVHPYLVMGPSDLITMVNSLFPEKRPVSSSLSRDISFGSIRSSASSVSGMSTIFQSSPITAPRNAFDNVSVISNSGSSVISDFTTSREPLLEENIKSRSVNYEDDGFELRVAIYEMTQTLGTEGVSGACHPCAEHWTVLFMSPDGQSLSHQLPHDPDEDGDEEEFTTSSDSDDDTIGSRSDLDKDYHQLRNSVLKLVEDYEIPQSLNPTAESETFSNRTSALESPRKKYLSRPGLPAHTQSRNPYRIQDIATFKDPKPSSKLRHDSDSDKDKEAPSVLITMLEAAVAQCQAQSDFVNAHLWWKTLNQLHQLSSPSLKRDGFASLLSIFSRGPRDSIRRSTSAVEEYDAWLVWLKQSQERHDVTIESMMKGLKAIRDKMWYVTDVKNSAAYEGARNIAIALKCMASPKKATHPPPVGTRPRNISKTSTNNFLLKTEAQVMHMMAASDDQGGPNKLSDEQSEKTSRWLTQFGIENFCKGEERIHRFCLEIGACINKLVGDNLMEGPVLWSSELYYRDKRLLDSGRQKGDMFLGSLGSPNPSGDDDTDTGRRGLRSTTDFNRSGPGLRDLRSMSARNTSQQSFDSGRYSMPRMSTAGDLMDSQDYFGAASTVLTVDSTTTFWSPFQTRAQSPTTSISSHHRPGTSSSSMNETVTMREERASLAKQSFLSDLKQTLTSLLISDLGALVFARGSETDSWFSGPLGEDCMERKERAERKARRKMRTRTLGKKKSMRDLRNAQKAEPPSENPDYLSARMERGASSAGSRSTEHGPPDVPSTTESSTSDQNGVNARKAVSKELDSPDFPYRKAFQRLLRMFSVHPNPYSKLNALFELEQLIIAYLTPSPPRRSRLRQEPLTAAPQSPSVTHINAFGHSDTNTANPRAKTLEQAIDNCKERRSHTLSQPDPILRSSPAAANPASTDMIVDVLQDLFRDAEIRPKTLFRDLQFIASFVPVEVLDKTERGKAFWDAGLAALGLKQDVCRTMIEIADEVVVHYTSTRANKSSSSAASAIPAEHTTASGELMKYSMQEAARMWTITAKEGDPVAERELAIFYLTHPELVERVTLPLSRPGDTFKKGVLEMHGGGGKGGGGGGGGAGGGGGEGERGDGRVMCVAFHWMEASALGGDELAKKYLRQREELNAIP